MAISELQIALVGAGVSAVVVVWAYNTWQERKHRKAAESIFRGGQDDALLDGAAAGAHEGDDEERDPYDRDAFDHERREPHLPPAPELPPELKPVAAFVPAAEPLPVPPKDGPQLSALPALWADPLMDCIVDFSTAEPIPAAAVWAAQATWAGEMNKPLRWLARGSSTADWQLVHAHDAGSYAQWAASLQLVNRQGAISDREVACFIDGVAQVATEVGAAIDLPESDETVMHAVELDAICAAVDIQFVLHIVEASGGVFAGTKLRGVAEASGLTLANDGCFHARDQDGIDLFTLCNMGQERLEPESIKSLATHGMTLSLDVPRVADGAVAFDQMLASARQLSKALGGILVDAQRAPLAEAMITGIRAKTIELQQTMRDAGIEPGSTRALRLFS